MKIRKASLSDVPDDEWAPFASYLVLLPEASGQRRHDLRDVFNYLRLRQLMMLLPPSDFEAAVVDGKDRSVDPRSTAARASRGRPMDRGLHYP